MLLAGRREARSRRRSPGGSPLVQAGERRSAQLESLRAIAALAVVFSHVFIAARVFHTDPASVRDRLLLSGGLGVFLFFALSGYLLFLPFAHAALGAGERVRVAIYARNRALRILPLYYVAVLIGYLLIPFGARAGDWWRYVLFLENYSPSTVVRLNPVIWSLVVEVEFYFLLPLLGLLLAFLARSSPRRIWMILGVLVLGSLAVRLSAVLLASTANVTGVLGGQFSLPSLFFYFAAGMAVAMLQIQRDGARGLRPRWLFAHGDLWLLASIPLWLLAASSVARQPFAAPAAFLVVGGCVLPTDSGRLVRMLGYKPLALIGVASYSLYLWHVPVVYAIAHLHPVYAPTGGLLGATGPPHQLLVLLAVSVPLCVLVAFVSYAAIEAPFLRYRERWSNATLPAELSGSRGADAGYGDSGGVEHHDEQAPVALTRDHS